MSEEQIEKTIEQAEEALEEGQEEKAEEKIQKAEEELEQKLETLEEETKLDTNQKLLLEKLDALTEQVLELKARLQDLKVAKGEEVKEEVVAAVEEPEPETPREVLNKLKGRWTWI